MTTKEIVKLGLFEGREIRKTVHNGEWWFSVADVVAVLTDSADTRQYIKRMRNEGSRNEGSSRLLAHVGCSTKTNFTSEVEKRRWSGTNAGKLRRRPSTRKT